MAGRLRSVGDNVTDQTRVEALSDCTASFAVVSELSDQLKTARAEHSNRIKRWKGRGVQTESLKKAIKDRFLDPDEVLRELHEYTRFRALQNMPHIQRDLMELWSDLDIDEERVAEIQRQRWRDDGAFAGRQGQPRDSNPHTYGEEAFAVWDQGWHEDQERIARAMGLGEPPAEAAPKKARRKAAGNGAEVQPRPSRRRVAPDAQSSAT
jgi:hypothetical protein